jgi:hypothetical protein
MIKKQPSQTLLQGKPYNHRTDVQETWKKFGWTPPKVPQPQQTKGK